MKVYTKGDRAYVEMDDKVLLCIGSKAEVDRASDSRIIRMVVEALAFAAFYAITSAKRQVIH